MKVNDFKAVAKTLQMFVNILSVFFSFGHHHRPCIKKGSWLPNHDFVIFGTSRLTYNENRWKAAAPPALSFCPKSLAHNY